MREAKRFFVDKIVAQAVAEGEPLSNSELRMLNFSELDPESPVEAVSADEPDVGLFMLRIPPPAVVGD